MSRVELESGNVFVCWQGRGWLYFTINFILGVKSQRWKLSAELGKLIYDTISAVSTLIGCEINVACKYHLRYGTGSALKTG